MDIGQPRADNIFGPYELIRELGRGSFGMVHLVRDTRNDTLVALKLPYPFVLKSNSMRRRFLRECEIGKNLSHPGIVKVIDSGEIGEIGFMISEYIDGLTLGDWLIDNEPVDYRIVALIGYHLAVALESAHKTSVIHRDLKPSNILIRRRKPDEIFDDPLLNELETVPCITDFGLARVLSEYRHEESWTGSNLVLGAPSYMAPEQALGRSDLIGPETDIHAVGILLYKIITGCSPFIGDSREAIIRRVIVEEAQIPSVLWVSLPEGLGLIIEKCLRKQPTARYRTARQLKDDLARFLNGKKPLARRKTYLDKTKSWARRHPVMATSVIAFLLTIFSVISLQAINNSIQREFIEKLLISNIENENKTRELSFQKEILDRAAYDNRLFEATGLLDKNFAERTQESLMAIDRGPDKRDFVWEMLWRRSRSQRELLQPDTSHLHALFAEYIPNQCYSLDNGIAISKKFNQIATFHEGSIVKIRHLDDGKVIQELEKPNPAGNICLIRYSRDETEFLILYHRIITTDQNTISEFQLLIRDQNSQLKKYKIERPGQWYITRAATAIDGQSIVCQERNASNNLSRITLINTRTGQYQMLSHVMPATDMVLLRDGETLLSEASDQKIHVQKISNPLFDMKIADSGEIQINPFSSDVMGNSLAVINKAGTGISVLNLQNDSSSVRQVYKAGDYKLQFCRWTGENKILALNETMSGMLIDTILGEKKDLVPKEQTANQFFSIEKDPPSIEVADNIIFSYNYMKKARPITVHQWDLNTAHEIPLNFQWLPLSLHDTKDGQSIYFSQERFLARYWLYANPEPLSDRLAGHTDEAWGAAFSPDGKLLATSSDDSSDPMTIRIWDWRAGRLVRGWKAHEATVSRVAFSPDGKILASCSLGKKDNLSLWDPQSGNKIRDLISTQGKIYSISFNQSGNILASADQDGVIILWDYLTGKIIKQIQIRKDQTCAIAFRPGSDNQLAVCHFRDIFIINTDSGEIIKNWQTSSEATSLNFSSDGRYLGAAEDVGSVSVWDMESKKRLVRWEAEGESLSAIRFIPDGDHFLVAVGDLKGGLHIWNLKTEIKVLQLKRQSDKIHQIAITPDGKNLATTSHDNSVILWRTDPIIRPGN